MATIGVIVNPHSKINKKSSKNIDLLKNINYNNMIVRVTGNLKELDLALVEFKKSKIAVLAINGGDGTISKTISALIHCYQDQKLPQILLLKGGTINVLAHNLGIHGSPINTLREFIVNPSSDICEVSTLKVNKNYGFIFGNGTAASFLKLYYKNKSDAIGASILLAKVIANGFLGGKTFKKIVKDHKVSIKHDNEKLLETKSIAIICSTIPKMPLGPLLFPKMVGFPQKFQSVCFTIPAKAAFYLVPIAGLLFPHKELYKITRVNEKIEIFSKTLNSYTIDGELYLNKSEKLTVELGPRISFIIPDPKAMKDNVE